MSELLEDYQISYKVCKVDNCAIRVKIQPSGFRTTYPVVYLLAKQCPHVMVYKITLGSKIHIESRRPEPVVLNFYEIQWSVLNEFFITWFGNTIRIGLIGHQHVLEFHENSVNKANIGFAKFITLSDRGFNDCTFESPPQTDRTSRNIKIKGGKLEWKPMNGDKLPKNAMIGGFQEEPIYIARARHRGSLCPGKYIPSKRYAYISWCHREFRKNTFEILCGFDAQWVKCEYNDIPENAFVGGTSENLNEPLYIGRAMVCSDLVCGKVHLLYNTCFIPYKGKELTYQSYEILVSSGILPRGLQESHCFCFNS